MATKERFWRHPNIFAGVFAFLFCACFCSTACPQHKLILRDLSVIETDSIIFDKDRITVSGNNHFGWDEVLTTTLAESENARFKQLVDSKGLPLYRIRHRLQIGDWASIGEIAEPLLEQIANQPATEANVRNQFLIYLGSFRARVAKGKRAASIIPLIALLEIRKHFTKTDSALSAVSLNSKEFDDEFVNSLLPIWFDAKAAKQVVSQLNPQMKQNLDQMSDGRLIYFASLSVAATKYDEADDFLTRLKNRKSNLAMKWHPIMASYRELKSGAAGAALNELEVVHKNLDGSARAVANFLVAAQYSSGKNDSDVAVLDLLQIPANFSTEFPALSAAALSLAAEITENAGRLDESKIIRSELSERFGNTYHDILQKHK